MMEQGGRVGVGEEEFRKTLGFYEGKIVSFANYAMRT